MKKLVILTIIFVLILVIALPIGLTFGIKFIPGGKQPSLGNTKSIYEQFTLSQSFISPKDNLAGIGVSIKNPNFANKKDAFVNIYDSANRVIRLITLNGQNIADGKFVKIFFEPIEDSSGKKFTWSISSPTSNFNDALQIFLTNNKPDWSLEFKVGDKLTDESLSYMTLHKRKNLTEVVTQVFSGWMNKLMGDFVFLITYSLMILILLGSILYFPKEKSPTVYLNFKKESKY